jgi:hypothetical protein
LRGGAPSCASPAMASDRPNKTFSNRRVQTNLTT